MFDFVSFFFVTFRFALLHFVSFDFVSFRFYFASHFTGTRNLDTKKKFKKIKHHIQKLLRQSYWQYIEDIVTPKETEGTFNSVKKFWTYIKHKKTDHQGISSLKQDGKLITDPIPKANVMNDQFKSAFSNIDTVTSYFFLPTL